MQEPKVPGFSEPAHPEGHYLLGEGRWTGGMLLVQIAGLIGPFIMLLPLVRLGPTEQLDPGQAPQLKAAVLWLALNSLAAFAITVVSWRSLASLKGTRAALLGMAAAVFVFQLVDNAHILTLMSLRGSTPGGDGAGDTVRILAEAEKVTRGWIHRSELLAVDIWVCLFYAAVWRARLLPRWIAGAGLLTVSLHFFTLVLPMFLGLPGVAVLGATMALTHLTSGVWLLVRGYEAKQPLDSSG